MNPIKRYKRNRKLKGMPKVYYFNLDSAIERKEFMESQFNDYGISYERVSQSKYVGENLEDWVHKFEDANVVLRLNSEIQNSFVYAANFLNHLEFMGSWLRSCDDEYLMVMEDDYDLSLIDYWHFDWEYLIRNLPCDWDAFKLNVDNPFIMKFFVHPVEKPGFSGFGAMIFKRSFVKKILCVYCQNNGKVKNIKSRSLKNYDVDTTVNAYNVDSTLTRIGSVYTAPLITTEASLCRTSDDVLGKNSSIEVFKPIQHACHQWWRNERHLFSLDDFFYYNKPNDEAMTIHLGSQIR
jgi:hypothetical protein